MARSKSNKAKTKQRKSFGSAGKRRTFKAISPKGKKQIKRGRRG